MSEFTREQLLIQFKRMPEETKEAITSFENAQAIKEISDKNNLHVDQMGELAEEVGLILLGLTKIYILPSRLTRALNIDRNQTNQIITDLNDKLFSKLQHILKTINTTARPATPMNTKSVFDQKLSGLFTTTKDSGPNNPNYQTPNKIDPYLELPE